MLQLTARAHCAQAVATALWACFAGHSMKIGSRVGTAHQGRGYNTDENLLGEASEAEKMTIHSPHFRE
jgi:hypothetical protein